MLIRAAAKRMRESYMNRKRGKKAGHRSWAPRGGKVSGEHCGDIMSVEARSAVMAKIRGKDTTPERTIVGHLQQRGFGFDQHTADLPGRPDIVFRDRKVAVFIDGDFWHGWRFPLWKHKLSPKWQEKIAATRVRDARNFRKLRRAGWTVLRLWEHQIESNPEKCIERIVGAASDAQARCQTSQPLRS
jgi:DNA mismatch endonuclease (patch repair protein)